MLLSIAGCEGLLLGLMWVVRARWLQRGGMAERFKAPVLKTGAGETPPGVRIPLPPPLLQVLSGSPTVLA